MAVHMHSYKWYEESRTTRRNAAHDATCTRHADDHVWQIEWVASLGFGWIHHNKFLLLVAHTIWAKVEWIPIETEHWRLLLNDWLHAHRIWKSDEINFYEKKMRHNKTHELSVIRLSVIWFFKTCAFDNSSKRRFELLRLLSRVDESFIRS
jgi:hypothetical protein